MMYDDEDCCVFCKASNGGESQKAKHVRLMTNAPLRQRCGHRFCQNCIDRNIRRGGQFACPVCGTQVRKGTLDSRLMEDIEVDRDATARRRVLAVLYKPKSEFLNDPQKYNEHLEMMEDAIYKLGRGGEEAKQIESLLKTYYAQHQQEVAKYASQKVEEDRHKAASVREAFSIQEMTAERARDADRLEKKLLSQRILHEKQYQLGDRDDAPPSLQSPTQNDTDAAAGKATSIQAKFLVLPSPPTVIKTSEGPRRLAGKDLKSRQYATGFDARKVSKHRSAFDLVSALNAWEKPQLKHFQANIPQLQPYQRLTSVYQPDGSVILNDDRPPGFFRPTSKCSFAVSPPLDNLK